MTATTKTRTTKRFRLAGNDNETIVADRAAGRRYRLAGNDNETLVDDGQDTEGHRLATKDNETVAEAARRIAEPVEDEAPIVPSPMRR